MTAEEARQAVGRVLARAREAHSGDPAACERWLRARGFHRLAKAHEEGRRQERERILECLELAEDRPADRREEILRRALSDDAPTAEELARELVEGELGRRSVRAGIL